MSRFVKYTLTGQDKRNGSRSPLTPGIVWPNILALQGLKSVLTVGHDHQEEYFKIEDSEYPGVMDFLLMYGDAAEIPKNHIDQILNSMALP